MPKHIKVDGINYMFDDSEMFYYRDNESREDLLVLGKEYSTWDFLNWNVELIEDQTIDIDSIEELSTVGITINEDGMTVHIDEVEKINEVIRGLKHLNKEIQSIKEKKDKWKN